jgi:hypothetical protein
MRKQLKKLLLMILLPVMALLPLQGVYASMDIEPSLQLDHVKMMSMQQNTSDTSDIAVADTRGCTQCEQHDCNENQCSHNGHCFSCPALITTSHKLKPNMALLVASAAYPGSVTVSQSSSLFRPPKI